MDEDQQLTKKERRELRRQLKKEKREEEKRKQKTKKLLTTGVIIVILTIIGFWVYRSFNRNPSSTSIAGLEEIGENDHVKGNREAKVTLIEYSDFQCPACGRYFPVVKQLNEAFPDQLRIVYRHFPLTQIHKNAFAAARAAEAANRQNKFWEMHDKLFEKQSDWKSATKVEEKFANYAEEIGMDKEQFILDYKDRSLDEKIKDDERSGFSAGVNSTPTFFLNGNELVNPQGFDDFKTLVESELEKVEVDKEE